MAAKPGQRRIRTQPPLCAQTTEQNNFPTRDLVHTGLQFLSTVAFGYSSKRSQTEPPHSVRSGRQEKILGARRRDWHEVMSRDAQV
jgi:hypothetical protein